MNRIEFGPLVTQQTINKGEVDHFFKYFLNGEIGVVDGGVFITHDTVKLDATDPQSNNILRPYIKNYLNEINWDGNYQVTRLWGNIYRSKDFIDPHVHRDCDLSFTLIVKAPPLEILNEKKSEGCLILTYGETPSFYQKIKPITHQGFLPVEGELFIFPQNLNHYTIPMSHPQAERISISGNISLN